MAKFPLYMQPENSDICGAMCLKMIASYYGLEVNVDELIHNTNKIERGVSMLELTTAAGKNGLKPVGIKIKSSQLNNSSFFPCIAHVNLFHFVVIYRVTKDLVYIADPSAGYLKKSIKQFENIWLHKVEQMGKLLLIEPSSKKKMARSSRG